MNSRSHFIASKAVLGKKAKEEAKAEVSGEDHSALKPFLVVGSGGYSSSKTECDETVVNRKLPSETAVCAAKTKPSNNGRKSKDVIPTKHDILMGRGVSYLRHPGNTRMQILVEEDREQYRNLSKHEKSGVVKTILRKLRKGGSRFLIRRGDYHSHKILNDEGWIIASKGDAYDKVCHALRGKHGIRNKSPTTPKVPETTTTTAQTTAIFTSVQSSHPPQTPHQHNPLTPSTDASGISNNGTIPNPNIMQLLLGKSSRTQQQPIPVQHGKDQQLRLPTKHLTMPFNNPVASQNIPTSSSAGAFGFDSRVDSQNAQPANPPSQRQQQQQQQYTAATPPDNASNLLSMNKQPPSQRQRQQQESYPVSVGGKAENNNSNYKGLSMDDISNDIAAALPSDTEPAILVALTRYLHPTKKIAG